MANFLAQRPFQSAQRLGHAEAHIEVTVINGATLHSDRQGLCCYTPSGEARHTLGHRQSPLKLTIKCNSSDLS